MSLLDPPAFSHRSRSNKRKQPPTKGNDGQDSAFSQLPQGPLNPFSHPPGLVHQFATAGLTEADENPAVLIPDFPHRSLGHGAGRRSVEPDSDGDVTDGDGKKQGKTKKKRSQDPWRDGHYEVLLQSVQQFLDRGEVDKAARTYGMLLQLRPSGQPVDIKRHNLWAIGAEILMREGETAKGTSETDHQQDGKGQVKKRWGRAANMNKVKSYFDTLIQQHPYDYKHPRATCAVDFWIALFNCEIYNVHTEHIMAVDCVANEDAGDPYAPDDSLENDGPEVRSQQRKEELRLRALVAMRDITKRMGELMQDLPYSKNIHLLRLRAMASLYIADLVVPMVDVSPSGAQDAQRARRAEQQTARDSLEKIVTNGGELDGAIRAMLYSADEDGKDPAIPLYSSLPIRGL